MITTNCGNLAKRINMLKSHGIEKKQENFKFEPVGSWGYEQQFLGYNFRMTDIQAALGLSQLKRLDMFVKQRNNLLSQYSVMLKELPVELLQIEKVTTVQYI